MKVRVKFTKEGPLRFIGHLDILRYFQKAVRRSGIEAAYSGGFSPHMIMSFAEPLGVGLTSVGEYFDMELAYEEGSCPSGEELCDMLNGTLSEYTRVLSVRRIEDGRKSNAMSNVAAASYTITFPLAEDKKACLAEAIEKFLSQGQIPAEKKTKSGMKTVDIRPLIFELKPCALPEGEEEGRAALSLFCSSGSAANLKPDAVCSAFFEFCGFDIPSWDVHARRDELYAKTEDGAFRSLEEMGEKIL